MSRPRKIYLRDPRNTNLIILKIATNYIKNRYKYRVRGRRMLKLIRSSEIIGSANSATTRRRRQFENSDAPGIHYGAIAFFLPLLLLFRYLRRVF